MSINASLHYNNVPVYYNNVPVYYNNVPVYYNNVPVYTEEKKPVAETQMPQDTVSISEEAQQAQAQTNATGSAAPNSLRSSAQLSSEQKLNVEKLKQRDTEVRQHEQAHAMAAGDTMTTGASFDYQKGPDGKQYAVGGQVNLDVSEGNTPEETIRKAETIKKAALAPANPSTQDKKVAAMAETMKNKAVAEQKEIEQEESQKQDNNNSNIISPFNAYAQSAGNNESVVSQYSLSA